MKKYFEKIDFNHFWNDHDYYRETCTGADLSDEMIAEAEEKLGCKLPQSYIALMKTQNGGKPCKNFWLSSNPKDIIGLGNFFSIGSEKQYSLFGQFSNEFWYEEWGYPRDIGVIIASTISAGHEMIYLDYRECGKNGEPKVSVCYQESDYEIFTLAENFEEFIENLVAEEELEEF